MPLATTLSLDSDVVQPLVTAFREPRPDVSRGPCLCRTMLAVALRFVVVVERGGGYDIREIDNETEAGRVRERKACRRRARGREGDL